MFVDKKKNLNRTFRDRLTFSSIHRTSRPIYRLALPLRAPETLSSLSKSRISILNAHLTLFVRRMTSHNSIGKYCHYWASEASPTLWGVQSRFHVIYMSVCMSVECQITWNHVNQTRACSKSVLGGKIRPVTPVLFATTIR